MNNKEIVTRKGLELVAYAGEARSYILEALEDARNGDFSNIDNLMKEAEALINHAHKAQFDLLVTEARGEYADVTLTMVHGQDHLMTTILLKELAVSLIELWKLSKK
ncbi:PTS system cellobiose-specific IIA component [Spiroplasma clarkii]|uniref:PTS system lactose-specific EIIA component n=1 Tax=Spiroplasma clarkii TaxID=2139 RepID=A0A1Y0KZ26_9MOLU|nr:PTS lactose/cellobiose transporter subunit IIA [Spiroplasma clarkii]ARU90994.1 PTS system cellobiose-specific IIA component [Spiroplasma clarkii]ATX70440.1 PTS system, lactose-specific IIA component [Spiroplasma clarkii]